ncbi:MAG: C39 family peptidase [Oscillospiraceae bacterium]|nr:C39 family peptidase [Oscillospiraceae bacterium]
MSFWNTSETDILNSSEIPERLLQMAETYPETLDFVKQYPELHDQHPEIDLTAEAESDTVPLLLQWDTRWGYESYGDGLIGYTGCGPTCLSMVALYLTGDPDDSPLAVAQYADENGYYVDGSGTAWSFMSQGAAHFGLSATEFPLSESAMKSALDAGEPIICVVGPGDFTPSGHFIVLTGYTSEGFTVNDPNSIIRSGQAWSFERLKGQIRNLWAYSGE